MTQREKIVAAILTGESDANIAFDELRGLPIGLGFVERIKGSHHIFRRPDVRERVNLQGHSGKAKPYQVRQVRDILLKYKLGGQR